MPARIFESTDLPIVIELMTVHGLTADDIAEKWSAGNVSVVYKYLKRNGRTPSGSKMTAEYNDRYPEKARAILRVARELNYCCSVRAITLAVGSSEAYVRDVLRRFKVQIDSGDEAHRAEMIKRAEYCRNLIANKICSRKDALIEANLDYQQYKYWLPRVIANKKAPKK
jgi:hypothetical protein